MHEALKDALFGRWGGEWKYGGFKLGMGAFKIRPSRSTHTELAPNEFKGEWIVNRLSNIKEHDDRDMDLSWASTGRARGHLLLHISFFLLFFISFVISIYFKDMEKIPIVIFGQHELSQVRAAST